jgi:hypothetical protein
VVLDTTCSARAVGRININKDVNMDEFSKLREQWYSAYVTGNTKELKSYESEHLQVIVNGQVDTGDRYDAIGLKVQSGAWFQPKLVRKEVTSQIEDGYLVEGTADVVTGKATDAKITYSELWYYESGTYKITRLNINT